LATLDDGSVIFWGNASDNGTWQLYRTTPDGGVRQLTGGEDPAYYAKVSPNGKWIAFGRDNKGNEKHVVYVMPSDGGDPIPVSQEGTCSNLGSWSVDGRYLSYANNVREPSSFDVYVYDREKGTSTPIFTGKIPKQDHGLGAWSHDGAKMLVTRGISDVQGYVFLVDVASGAYRPVITPDDQARIEGIHFSSDGKKIYALADVGDRDLLTPMELDLETGAWRDSFPAKGLESDSFRHSVNGRWEVVSYDHFGYSEVSIRNGRTGKVIDVNALLPEPGVLYGFTFSPAERFVSFTFTSPSTPTSIWRIDLRKEKAEKAWAYPLVVEKPPVVPELVSYTSFDGIEIRGILYRPSGADTTHKTPVIMDMHGGPSSARDFSWAGRIQYLCSKGIGVFQPNVRGSSGRGKAFQQADNGLRRLDSVKDMIWGALYLRDVVPWVDSSKLVLSGGSYGGYMVLAGFTLAGLDGDSDLKKIGVSHGKDLWIAGMEAVGISDWISFLEGTASYRTANRQEEYGRLDVPEERKFLEGISPLLYADRIENLLVIHGKNDARVPFSQAEQIVRAVQSTGGQIVLLSFENEGHGSGKRQNQAREWNAQFQFLQKMGVVL
ncbi:MAG TPA: prolyl oligopeptidase family serine peptidase, partial [Patescibacteria group bacterium]|nr:prolyl oligopeptidase family serine peptidase [Patescibacteria group bacterium]